MAQDDKPDSLNNKIDALSAMAGGEDISHQGFNAIEEISDAADSEAAVTLAAQAPSASAPEPAGGGVSMSNARRARASSLKRQAARVHAEQFKRMMVPILIVTGVLLLLLGAVVAFVVRPDGGFQRVMVITSFPMGAILLVGAWLFYADLKRADLAEQRENERN